MGRRRSGRTRTSTPGPAGGSRTGRPGPGPCRTGAAWRRGYRSARDRPAPVSIGIPGGGFASKDSGRGLYLGPVSDAADPRPRSVWTVPDKPGLEGLEARWVAHWKAQGTYRFDRTKTRDQIYSIDTPPPTVSGSLHVGHVFSLHPHRPDRPLPADARPRGLLPDGLGRQRPAHRAPGAELLRRALRPVAALRPRLRRRPSRRPTSPRRRHRPPSSAGRNFVELCETADRRGREGLRGPVPARSGLSVDWSLNLHDHRRPQPQGGPARRSCATWPAARPTRPRRRRCGTSTFRTAVAQAELEDRDTAGAYHRIGFHRSADGRRGRRPGVHRDHPARAAGRLRGPGGPSRRRALPAAVRHDGAHAAVRRRGAGGGPPAGRARQGLGHRHDLHLRRPDRRDLVARARPAHPRRSSGPTAACWPTRPTW